MVVRPDFHLFRAGVVVVRGKDGGWRAGFVHQGDWKEGARMGTYGKVDPIEISKGVENRFNFVAMDLTVLDDFLIQPNASPAPTRTPFLFTFDPLLFCSVDTYCNPWWLLLVQANLRSCWDEMWRPTRNSRRDDRNANGTRVRGGDWWESNL